MDYPAAESYVTMNLEPTMERLDKIHIRDLLQRCTIGIYDEERCDKQDIVINITLHAASVKVADDETTQ